MTPKNNPEPISDYLLERLAAGDLTPARAESLRSRLAAEANGPDRLAALAESNAEILRAYPPAAVTAEIRRRLATATTTTTTATTTPSRVAGPRARRSWSWGLSMALVAATAVVLVARGTWWNGAASGPKVGSVSVADGTGDTLKGLRPGLRVYRKAQGRIERLQDGAVTRAGDQLQLSYVAAGHRFGAVLSTDGAGQVTFHLPAVAGPAVRLRTDGETALPAAYELDTAPGFERFLFVAGDEPFDAASLVEVAKGRTALPPGRVAVYFTVRKP